MSRPSVLILNRAYPPLHGASGRILQDLALALQHSGWRVTILTTGFKKSVEVDKNITIKRAKGPEKPTATFAYVIVWIKLLLMGLKESKHDVVITMTDPPMLLIAGRIISRFKRAPHIHWCQDLYPDLFRALGYKLPKFWIKFMHRASRRALKNCAKVVVVGRCLAERLVKTGVPADKVKLIANWTDFEVIAPSSKGDHTLLPVDLTGVAKKPEEMFRDDSPKFRVLYAGNIGRAHPMRTVVEAATILAEHSEIEFVFVGDHQVPEDTEISKVIHEYGAGTVIPVGKAQELADAIYKYRLDGDTWFQAQEGALRAGQAYHPNQSLHKWLELLEDVNVS